MSIELNFLALQEQVFDFTIYVRAYSGNEKSNFYIASLSVNNKESTLIGEHRERFEVSLSSIEGFFERLVNCTENHRLTIWYISQRIYQGKEFLSNHYRRDSFNKNNPVSYIRAEDVQGGYRELSVRPFYYKKVKLFGFIYGFHYKKENIDEKLNTLDLINSFSLDKGGKSNKNKNYDVRKYLSSNFKKILSPFMIKLGLPVIPKLLEIESHILDKVEYLGKNGVAKKSFISVKNNGCYRNAKLDRFTFVFLESDRQFARDIYFALKGETFPEQFSGMQSMFDLSLDKSNVDFLLLKSISPIDRHELLSKIQSKSCGFLIFCLYSREDEGISDFYLNIKLECLKKNIPSQFLYKKKFINKESLRWSISNIGLQIFSKAGGIPWAVQNPKYNENNKSIIIGIGTSHDYDDEGNIKKYFAYAICSDGLGIFKFALPIAFSSSENGYYHALDIGISELKSLLDDKKYKYVSIHMTENIKMTEAYQLEKKIKGYFTDMILFILKISKNHDFIGFSISNHTIVSAGVFVELSFNQYLIWTDGVENMQIPNRRYANPLLVEFRFPEKEDFLRIGRDNLRNVLQDIYILSLANWRGFNAEATPITLVYAKLIADFIKNIKKNSFDDIDVNFPKTDLPWFL